MFCECGRKITITLHPGRNPRRGSAKPTLPDEQHALCRKCYRSLMAGIMVKQRMEKRQ